MRERWVRSAAQQMGIAHGDTKTADPKTESWPQIPKTKGGTRRYRPVRSRMRRSETPNENSAGLRRLGRRLGVERTSRLGGIGPPQQIVEHVLGERHLVRQHVVPALL